MKGATQAYRVGKAVVDCSPHIQLTNIAQRGQDANFLLAGGCDGDRYLDQGESFSLQVRYFNEDLVTLEDATVSLTSDSPYIAIDQASKPIGELSPFAVQRTSFGIRVVGTPPGRTQTNFNFCVAGPKTGQGVEGCVQFKMLLQADDEEHYYITDCPTGCGTFSTTGWPTWPATGNAAGAIKRDWNFDEKFERTTGSTDAAPVPVALPTNLFDADNVVGAIHRGMFEYVLSTEKNPTTGGVRYSGKSYEDLTSTAYGHGNSGFVGPWNFDTTNNGFRTGREAHSQRQLAQVTEWGEDANWDGTLQAAVEDQNGDGTLNQNWGTTGGCGWQSKGTGTTGGVWHTGTVGTLTVAHKTSLCNPPTRENDSVCEQYDVISGTTGQKYWFESLRTPAIHPVHFGDASGDGYAWQSQILDWSWNAQSDIADLKARQTWEFDLDLQDGTANVLGDSYISNLFGEGSGVITGGQLDVYGGAPMFNNTNKSTGDGLNGTKGTNRTAERGCFFNDLTLISDSAPMTAANRQLNLP